MNFRHLSPTLRWLATTALAWGVALSAVYAAADVPVTVDEAQAAPAARD